jgi:hypothetical protein
MNKLVLAVFAVATLWSGRSLAQSEAPVKDTDTEISKQVENR